MILVLCCNAAMDRTYQVDHFRAGGFHQTSQFRVAAGGKGINVARMLRNLGQEVMVSGFAGGMIGRFILTDLRNYEIKPAFVQIAEQSRLCQNFVDSVNHTETRVDEAGPLISPNELRQMVRLWKRVLAQTDISIAVISGSTPRGVPDTLYHDLITLAHEADIPVVLDAHDALLAHAIPARPTIITPNISELQTLVNSPVSVPQGVQEAAGELIEGGIELVLTSIGPRGAIAVTESGSWMIEPAQIEVVSPVGSGDAMVAALVAATAERLPLPERLKWAVAAGTANAATFGASVCDRAAIEALLDDTSLTPLD